MTGHGVGLEISGLTKRYGSVTALDAIDLSVAPGEFMTFLGPSGSGKTTTLNLIAGFAQPDAGSIFMGDRPLVGVPTHQRDIGVVFQNYALFPHMKVESNVAFPLRQRGLAKAEITRQVGEILEIVGLEHLAARYPRELSGGQQQRVALARALVFGPKLLLLDEPLGALDKRLREGLQLEIKRIHREVGVTFVFVTHDQEEALVMSDRIAVFNEGRIEQVAHAKDMYEQPRTLFAAQFLGDSNVITGVLGSASPHSQVVSGDFSVVGPPCDAPLGASVALVLRPEHIAISTPEAASPTGCNSVPGVVQDTIYLGGRRRVVVGALGREFLVDQMAPDREFVAGDPVLMTWRHEVGTVVHDSAQSVALGRP